MPKAVRLLDEIYGNLNYNYYQVNEMEVYDYNNYLNTLHMIDRIRTVSRKDVDMLLHEKYLPAGEKFIVGTLSDIKEKNDRVYVVYAIDRDILATSLLLLIELIASSANMYSRDIRREYVPVAQPSSFRP